jgi:probable F420-dependent oxidoreductase
MQIGLFGINTAVFSTREAIMRVAQTAEQAGFESLWTGEHLVAIDPQVPPSPIPPHTRMVDTVATLAFVAAVTERVKLGSGIILLAQRNPVVLAKELSAIDVLSDGRLMFGVGVGYVKQEFDVIGVPFEERGARVTEHIEAIRSLWTQNVPEFDGEFTKISGVQSHPHPVQQPHPPIVIGGMSPVAFRRAVSQGNGWYGFFQDLDATAASIKGLADAAKRTERPAALGKLEISITPPPGNVDLDLVKRYEDLGVSRLILMRGFSEVATQHGEAALEDGLRFVTSTAETLKLG